MKHPYIQWNPRIKKNLLLRFCGLKDRLHCTCSILFLCPAGTSHWPGISLVKFIMISLYSYVLTIPKHVSSAGNLRLSGMEHEPAKCKTRNYKTEFPELFLCVVQSFSRMAGSAICLPFPSSQGSYYSPRPWFLIASEVRPIDAFVPGNVSTVGVHFRGIVSLLLTKPEIHTSKHRMGWWL